MNKILSGGTTEPKLPSIMAIASALGVSADYLIYGESKPLPGLSPLELDLLHKFNAIGDDARARIINQLNFEYMNVAPIKEDDAG